MSSEEGRLSLRKRISVEKPPEISPNSKKQRESSSAPDVQLSKGSNGLFDEPDNEICDETETVECAVIALLSWNRKSLSEQGPEYELVDALGCRRMVGPTYYHCNFIARPKNATSEAEDKLFFAELKYSKDYAKDGEDVALGCRLCCILGPTGTETGVAGCSFCSYHHSVMHHPLNQAITKSRMDIFVKHLRKHGKPSINSGRVPLLNHAFCTDTPSKKEVLHCVKIALSGWNKKSVSEQGPEYQPVELLVCRRWTHTEMISHCNFIARPKNGSEAEDKLFFAEFMYVDRFGSLGCTACCILGPRGIKTGLAGCVMCKKYLDLVQHPVNGEFTKGPDDALAKRKCFPFKS